MPTPTKLEVRHRPDFMKRLLAYLLLVSLAWAQPTPPATGSLTVNKTTGAITAPVSEALFKSGNSIGSGSGTVTSVSVVTANGVSGSVATATTTPAITLTLGAITPSSVSTGALTSSSLTSGRVPFATTAGLLTDASTLTFSGGTLTATTFSGALSGTSTNATNVGVTDDTTTNATMYPAWFTAATGNLPAKVSSTKMTFNPSTGTVGLNNLTSLTGSALTLATLDTNKSINLMPNGTGTVGVGITNDSTGPRVAILDSAASTTPAFATWVLNGSVPLMTFSEATRGILVATAGSNRPIISFRHAGGTLAVPTTVADGQQLANLNFDGYDGTNFVTSGKLDWTVDGTVSTGLVPSKINFSVFSLQTGGMIVPLVIRSSGGFEFAPAQPASLGTSPGTAAGNLFTYTSPTGGNTTIATTGTGGSGGATLFSGGAGGTAPSATTASTGGNGGIWRVAGGTGGAAAVTGAGTGTGGIGSEIRLISGTGGAASTSTGVNTGGAGGAWTLTTGNGGAATSGSTNTGGAGGAINLTTGNGGAGATAAGNSGTITLDTGTAGAGGTVGSVILKTGGTARLTITGAGAATFSGAVTNSSTTTMTGAVTQTAKTTTYNNIATAGWGLVAIQGSGGSAANSNVRAAAAATYTVGAADGTFVVSGNILINTGTVFSMSLDCVYTDQGNTSRTLVLPLAQLAGTFVTTGLATNVTGTGPYESASMTIRCKAATSITIRPSAGGTYTTVNYDVYGSIRQIE